MKLAIIGTGYVGLVTGAGLSEFGHSVVCVDTDEDRIGLLREGVVPFYEPRLESVIARNTSAGRLSFSTEISTAVASAEVIFITVGTPSKRIDGDADLSYIRTVAKQISPLLTSYIVVAIKSTVPVGTCRVVRKIILREAPVMDFDVVSNPEFLREGAAIQDFTHPDRVIVGADNQRAAAVMGEVYRPLYLREYPIVYCSPESAEMIKYASNAFLATKISFINEISALCERTGADVKSVAYGMGLDNRIGNKFLHAGPGYGGSCFPKDTRTLALMGNVHGVPQTITEAVIGANETAKQRMINKILNVCEGSVSGKRIVIFGVTFKPNTDDLREAPSLTIVPWLIDNGAEVRIVDPKGFAKGQELLPGATWFNEIYEACSDSEAIVILTEWNEFRALDLAKIARSMAHARMADLRNIYDSESAQSAGFERYECVGRP